MKVLSVMQPWASLIVAGHKRIETKPLDTKHRGELLIHASLSKRYGKAPNKLSCRDLNMDFQQEFFDLQLPKYEDLPFGYIIGKVNLDWTVDTHYCFEGNTFIDKGKRFEITKQELAFGDYSEGRFGWLLSDPVQFVVPIPAKGQLGLWNYDLPTKIPSQSVINRRVERNFIPNSVNQFLKE